MVYFDPELNRVVVTIVYDGPASAGKTTNVRQLASSFTSLRRTEVASPNETHGETVSFDRFCVDAGLAEGRRIRLHILSAPGHETLSRERDALIALADVVVFVCDSTSDRMRWVVERYRRLRTEYGHGVRRVVVQANKQDADDALDERAVRDQLRKGLSDDAFPPPRVVAARAHEGVGVRETARVAFAMAADLATEALRERSPEDMARRVPTVDDLLRYLEFVSQPPPSSTRASDRAPNTDRMSVVRGTLPPKEGAPPRAMISQPRLKAFKAPRRTTLPVGDEDKLPPWPGADTPSGHLWPAARARSVLAELTAEEPFFAAREAWESPESSTWLRGSWRCSVTRIDDENPERGFRRAIQTQQRLGSLGIPDLLFGYTSNEVGDYLWRIHLQHPSLEDAIQLTDDPKELLALVRIWLDAIATAFFGEEPCPLLRPELFVLVSHDKVGYAGPPAKSDRHAEVAAAMVALMLSPWSDECAEYIRFELLELASRLGESARGEDLKVRLSSFAEDEPAVEQLIRTFGTSNATA